MKLGLSIGYSGATLDLPLSEAVAEGTTFGAPTPGEVLLAETMCARIPGLEQVRLVSSGTEALMSAVRLARGITGRDKILNCFFNAYGHPARDLFSHPTDQFP